MPHHVYLRYFDPRTLKFHNIEPTWEGGIAPDEDYVERFSPSPRSIQVGSHLRMMSYREFIAHILVTNSVSYARAGQYPKTISCLRKAIVFDPLYVTAYEKLATC